MKKMILGASLALLINYCIGSTYLLYKSYYKKGRDKNV
jgi:hypothetical protein